MQPQLSFSGDARSSKLRWKGENLGRTVRRFGRFNMLDCAHSWLRGHTVRLAVAEERWQRDGCRDSGRDGHTESA